MLTKVRTITCMVCLALLVGTVTAQISRPATATSGSGGSGKAQR